MNFFDKFDKFNESNVNHHHIHYPDSIAEVPELLKDLYKKSLKYKEPKFIAKSTTGSIRYHCTWNEIMNSYNTRHQYVLDGKRDMEWLKKGLEEFDVYGTTKPKNSESLLYKTYNHPSEIPKEVYELAKKQNIITSDATDAVRWSRIIDTENEERYQEGETFTVYRAVENKNWNEIREGDWITTEEWYAEEHLERNLNGKGHVISMEVKGEDILVSPTGNYEEAIYAPLEFSKPFEFYKKKRK